MAARKHPAKQARSSARGGKGEHQQPWFLYVAECADRTLYVGIAKDVGARIDTHNSGRGARYTRTRTPVRVVYTERLPDIGSALRREREIKRWSRPQKVVKLGLACVERLCGSRRRRAAA